MGHARSNEADPMFLPMFPLEIAVFPGETLPLHILEARYKQLIIDCCDEGITFGMPPVLGGSPARYGTRLELTRVLRTYDNDEMDILTHGLEAFRIERFHREAPGKLYAGGDVALIENDSTSDKKLRGGVIRCFNEFRRILRSKREAEEDDVENLSFRLAHQAGLTVVQKVTLLSMAAENDRLVFLRDHLQKLVQELPKALQTARKVGSNGHAKNFPRPE